MTKASDNPFPSALFEEQASAPTTPATGFWRAYFKSDGLYIVDDAGTETGPFGTGGGGGGLTQAYVGYNTVGGTAEDVVDNRVYMKKVTLANDCLLTSIEVYIQAKLNGPTGSISAAVLADNAGDPKEIIAYCHNSPDSIVPDDTSTAALGAARWVGVPIGKWVTAGDYWIAVADFDDTSGTVDLQVFKDGSGTDRYYLPTGNWFSDGGFTTVTTTTDRYSIRANTVR